MEPRKDLIDAITNKKRILFVYNETKRKGEPQCYGINTRDNEAIRMYQIERESSVPEELLLVNAVMRTCPRESSISNPNASFSSSGFLMVSGWKQEELTR
jgi:hypothetical protein